MLLLLFFWSIVKRTDLIQMLIIFSPHSVRNQHDKFLFLLFSGNENDKNVTNFHILPISILITSIKKCAPPSQSQHWISLTQCHKHSSAPRRCRVLLLLLPLVRSDANCLLVHRFLIFRFLFSFSYLLHLITFLPFNFNLSEFLRRRRLFRLCQHSVQIRCVFCYYLLFPLKHLKNIRKITMQCANVRARVCGGGWETARYHDELQRVNKIKRET